MSGFGPPCGTVGSKKKHSLAAASVIFDSSRSIPLPTMFAARLGRLIPTPICALTHSVANRFKVLSLCAGVRGGTFRSSD